MMQAAVRPTLLPIIILSPTQYTSVEFFSEIKQVVKVAVNGESK